MYTCFVHPQYQQGEQSLADICPEPGCARPYSWPLDHPPATIGGYKVIRPLGRGFYAATYLVESGLLKRRDVLKVTPTAFYTEGIKKTDFLDESQRHMQVAAGTSHLAQIRDVLGYEEGGLPVQFGDATISCFVSVLDYVDGRPLADYLAGEATMSARAVAQIAVDLLSLLRELEAKSVQHNDLHDFNILVADLPDDARRAYAIDESVRAVAIDFGSLADDSASVPGKRLSDVHQVATHLRRLSRRLLMDPQGASDDDYRLASALDQLARQMTPVRVNQRPIDFEEQARRIRDTVFLTDSPWRDPGALPRFGEAYNAATLNSWYVPKLLVDPGGEWLRRISTSGPQLITGMRGCGKTMLLRALEIHGRAAGALQEVDGDAAELRGILENDHWVGLYESATRLLDTLGDDPFSTDPTPLHEPHARLLMGYAREAVQAVRHLTYLNPDLGVPGYVRDLGAALATHIRGADDLADIESDIELERALQRHLISLAEKTPDLRLSTNPAVAFPSLAEAIRKASPLWHQASVLFLLDDVSTRNLHAENIQGLWSSLLFKDERCAFKMTTEAQTVEQLQSPGLIETAQVGRDVDIFYLDEEVNSRTRQRGPDGGRSFIAKILKQRANLYDRHPQAHPEQVLGGGTLEAIARDIASAAASGRKETTAVRKTLNQTYRGLHALSAVCVGDIGDVIAIYEEMLRKAPANPSLPLAPELQSSSFQQYSRRRLYHLNRRGDDLRSFATSFAEAAHELLADSFTGKGRLRQYSSIHIQIDRERQSEEYKKILRLVDAGIFVFDPGDRPRLRTGNADPTASFILNYRKLFGVFSYIGLGDRDRFELRGDAITEWLSRPDDPTVLTSRLGVPIGRSHQPPEPEALLDEDFGRLFSDDQISASEHRDDFLGIDEFAELSTASTMMDEDALREQFLAERVPHVDSITLSDLKTRDIATLVVGLGFEERTRDSAIRLLERAAPRHLVAISYPDKGYSTDILDAAHASGIEVEVINYQDFASRQPGLPSGTSLVDTTGLTKALIFALVEQGLVERGGMLVAHTRAQEHWPLNGDIQPLLDRYGEDYYGLMEAMEALHSGDIAPYRFVKLLASDSDQARGRALCAAVTAKHERLLSFLEQREYDEMQITVPASSSARGKIALVAADIAGHMAARTTIAKAGSDDLPAQLREIGRRYHHWYHRGLEVEFALTGSKMHAVACAALASSVKVGQCWYVRPNGFDTSRFSRGTGETEVFAVSAAPILTANASGGSPPTDDLAVD
jgi:serine/threonine protein kinase